MRAGKHWGLGAALLGALIYLGWQPSRGQEPPRLPSPPPLPERKPLGTLESPASPEARAETEFHDPAKLDPVHRGIYMSARMGAEWLWRANRPDGLFLYGYIPSLDVPMEGDSFLRQIGGAFALARAARFTGNPHYAARAKQAILTLLTKTEIDPKDPSVRSFRFPSSYANRLGAAGLLLLAIHELPDPANDLLEQSDQLCQFIRKQQQADGSLQFEDERPDSKTPNPLLPDEDKEGINYYPGEALYGLMRSQQHRPAAWKTDVARKALEYYRGYWRKNQDTALVPWQTSAYTEAHLLTKDKAFADFVFELNDWMCALQYDHRHPTWQGGFAIWMEGKAVAMPPRVGSASYAEGLADACRVARQAGDVQRFERYRDATQRCLQFLETLQYTAGNTKHFAGDYRQRLYGAFFGSHQDGTLRIDYTQHAVCAMIQYLEQVAEIPAAPLKKTAEPAAQPSTVGRPGP